MKVFTIKEAAAVLQITPVYLRLLLKRRGIAGAYRLGDGPRGRWRIPEAALVEAQRAWAAPEKGVSA